MALNWKEINLILEELNLKDSFIRQINQPDHDRLVLDIYNTQGSFKILIVLSNRDCRLHILTKKLKNPEKPLRFASFLRAHIKNSRITDIEHFNNDRIIKFSLKKGNSEIRMWVRLWSASSNIIITDNSGKILETFYRKKNKGEITGGIFNPEIKENKNKNDFEIRDLPGEGSFNIRLEEYYSNMENTIKTDTVKNSLLKSIENKISGIRIKIREVRAKESEYENFERSRQAGDIIEANIHKIKKGDLWLKAEDFFNNNELIEIQLNSDFTPIENAEYYYKLYKKHKNGLKNISREIDFLNNSLKELETEKEKIYGTQDPDILKKQIKPEVKIKKTDYMPGNTYFSGEYRIIVGRKAADNDTLLRQYISGNDCWLHVRDYPGAYVFIKNKKGKSIPLEVLLDAASLAVFYSKARASGQADVYYTQAKYLRRPKNGKKGLVLPTQEKNLHIKLENSRLSRLFKN